MNFPLDHHDRVFALPWIYSYPKRFIDILVSFTLLILLFPFLIFLVAVATFDTREFGIFKQQRVGLYGEFFTLYKIRTMRSLSQQKTNVTIASDIRITSFGRWLRRAKLDELPQLWNVLKGDMSLVGPRPDVFEVYQNSDPVRLLQTLRIKPGLTGPASLAFWNEEDLLNLKDCPETYNREVLFPAKLELNEIYLDEYSIIGDLNYLARTVLRWK